MQLFYRILADLVLVVHFSYVAFVVVGLLAVLVGYLRQWRWTRGVTFRVLHLIAMLIVAVETVWGVTCPLTIWEQALRARAGQASYHGDFIATWVHHLLFYDAPAWVFTTCYLLFGLLVLLTFFLVPPDFRRRDSNETSRPAA